MEIQIVFMRILTYIILFNSCLTFRLKLKNNIIITAILAFNMIIVGKFVGNLFVIPLFIFVNIYISYLKKEDRLWNVFLIIFSFTLLVIVDNMTHFIFSILNFDLNLYWPLYMLVDYPIFFVICRLMSKKVVKVKNKKFLPLSPKILTVVGADLILCMLIFVMHITVSELAGSSSPVLLVSIILYIAYVILTLLMITTIIREYEINANIMLKQNSYDNLQEYSKRSIMSTYPV